MIRYKLLPVLLFISFGLSAQSFDHAKMDSLFARIEANSKGMGSFSIFKDGREIYQNSIGQADIKAGVAAEKNTKYRIGSISKTFTAAMMMQLVEEKKLTLDTKLSKYYPEIPNADRITIEHLLRHRSGLFNITEQEDYMSWMEKPISKAEMLKKISSHEADFAPGENAAYSNTNYILLSFIIEDLEKKQYREVLDERIVMPLSLQHTYYGGRINTANGEAQSYEVGDKWQPATETDMSVPMGAGGIVSTPSDLNSFYTALFNGKVVSAASLDKMKTLKNNFGMALLAIPFYEKKSFGHGGGIDGFQSMVSYFPEEKVAVAYISNGVAMPINDIMIGALSIYFGKEYDLPEFKPALELTSEDLDEYLGVYGSPKVPLKLTITKSGNALMAQGTGQPSFPLEAYEKHKFKFDQAMLKIEFMPKEGKLVLKQGGGEFEMERE